MKQLRTWLGITGHKNLKGRRQEAARKVGFAAAMIAAVTVFLMTAHSMTPVDALLWALAAGLGTLAMNVSCSDVPAYVCDPCGIGEKGRIRAVAYVKKDYTFTDPTDSAEWQSAIASGDAIVIPFTRGTYDGGSATENEGFGAQATQSVGRQHQAQYFHKEVKENVDFYDILNYSREWVLWYVTESQVWNTGVPAHITAGAPVEAGIDSEVAWDVTVKWSNPLNPTPYDLPGGIFDRCSEIAPGSAEEVSLLVASDPGNTPWDGVSTLSASAVDGDPASETPIGLLVSSNASINVGGAALTQTGFDPGITFTVQPASPPSFQQGGTYFYAFDTLVASSGVTPGTYSGTLTFTLGSDSLTVPVEVTVS